VSPGLDFSRVQSGPPARLASVLLFAPLGFDAYMDHTRIMRTTVNIPDHLYVETRRLAAERRTSVTALLEEALRSIVAEARQARPPRSDRELPVMDGGQLRKGIDLTDTSELWDL